MAILDPSCTAPYAVLAVSKGHVIFFGNGLGHLLMNTYSGLHEPTQLKMMVTAGGETKKLILQQLCRFRGKGANGAGKSGNSVLRHRWKVK